jgi:hypothetical protein
MESLALLWKWQKMKPATSAIQPSSLIPEWVTERDEIAHI